MAEKKKFTFISLASGSSGNCYYLQTSAITLLIDAGIGPRVMKKRLAQYNLNYEGIDAILITHDHADHIKGVGYFGEKRNVPVYATEKVHAGMNRSYCMTYKLTNSARVVEKEVTFSLGDVQITPFEVSHDSTDSVGYLLQIGDLNFCVCTDVGHLSETVIRYASQAQLLVLESNYDEDMLQRGPYPYHLKQRIVGDNGHLSNADAARFVREFAHKDVRHIWLCHLSQDNNHPQLAYKNMEQALMDTGHIVGEDVQLDVLKRLTPSDMYIYEYTSK